MLVNFYLQVYFYNVVFSFKFISVLYNYSICPAETSVEHKQKREFYCQIALKLVTFHKNFVINKKYFFKNIYIFLTVISNLNLFLSIGNIQFHLLKNGIAMFYIGLVS